MGSGASTKRQKPQGKQGQQGGQAQKGEQSAEEEDTDDSPKKAAPVLVDCSGDPPFLRRRRRVLFGTPRARFKQQQFESVPPESQFLAEAPVCDDPVFDRFGSLEVVNQFRQEAEAKQYQDAGFLRENAIELLDLGLKAGSPLSKLLFDVAQAQHVANMPMKKRPKLLTCYELLALHSVLRAGEEHELLELLYCLFDADEDDRLNVADLTTAIDVFLGLQEAAETLEEQEQEDFNKFDPKERHAEAKRLAELAVQTYGSTVIDPESEDEEEKNRLQQELEQEDEEDPFLFGDGTAPGEQKPDATMETKKEHSDEDESRPLKPKLDDDSDDDSDAPKDAAKEKTGPAPKKAPRRRGLCMGKLPADSASEGESLLESKKAPPAKAAAKPKLKPKPKPKPGAQKKGGLALCGGGRGKRKGPPALNYSQWQKWLATSELLPPGFAGLELVKPEPGDLAAVHQAQADTGAGIGGVLSEPFLPKEVARPRSPSSEEDDDF